jgi:hypothetical protein
VAIPYKRNGWWSFLVVTVAGCIELFTEGAEQSVCSWLGFAA